MSTTAPSRRRALLTAVAVAVVALGLGSAALWATGRDAPSTVASSAPTGSGVGTAGSDPRSDETAPGPRPGLPDANPTSAAPSAPPAAPPDEEAAPPADDPSLPAPDGRGTVEVMVTYVGWDAAVGEVVVGSYVPDLVESGGSCTLTLTQGSSMVSATTSALADAASTVCGDLAVPGASLMPGTWSASVTYESNAVVGLSDTQSVEVP